MNAHPEPQWTQALLGLGGNLGDPAQAMARALNILDTHEDCRVEAVSSLYRTPPWGVLDQPEFLNCCAQVATQRDAQALLDLCQDVERGMKRVRGERWGPRTIDIDILTYGDERIETSALTIPHPHITERAFVLVPLADIAPALIIAGRTVADWAETADRTGLSVEIGNGEWWRGAPAQSGRD